MTGMRLQVKQKADLEEGIVQKGVKLNVRLWGNQMGNPVVQEQLSGLTCGLVDSTSSC